MSVAVVVPAGVGGLWIVHVDPSQLSTSICGFTPFCAVVFPTAIHAVADQHETFVRYDAFVRLPVVGGVTALCTRQVEPFQRSARAESPPAADRCSPPTAVHAVGAEQEIASRPLLIAPGGSAIVSNVHREPFHPSPSGRVAPLFVFLDCPPTAMQAPTVGQATSDNPVGASESGGVGCIVHAVPFQRSTNADSPGMLSSAPTATHTFGVAQETPVRSPPDGSISFWGCCTIQFEPCHRSATVEGRSSVVIWPTVTHTRFVAHEIPAGWNGPPATGASRCVDHLEPVQRSTKDRAGESCFVNVPITVQPPPGEQPAALCITAEDRAKVCTAHPPPVECATNSVSPRLSERKPARTHPPRREHATLNRKEASGERPTDHRAPFHRATSVPAAQP